MYKRREPATLCDKNFVAEVDGEQVGLYRLANSRGMSVAIMNHGGKVVSVCVPDKNGEPVDVVLGHDTFADYKASEEQYFGALCGRYANRIALGKFQIDGVAYELPINNGPNSLHGGVKGFNDVVWKVVRHSEQELLLAYTSADGEEGYPGALAVEVLYRVPTDRNALQIEYRATTSKPTVLNLTNHSYFNLSGEGDPSVHDHLLQIEATHYLPTDDTAIPYGPAEEVKGTPFDFTEPHPIGERIDEKLDQLVWARGYDHTYVLSKPEGSFAPVATCWSPKSGVRLTVATDQPGMQLYTGNWMSGNMRGKGRAVIQLGQRFVSKPSTSPIRPTTPNTLLPS